MKLVLRIAVVVVLLGFCSGLLALQRSRLPRYGYGGDAPAPYGSGEKTEWAFARLRYRSSGGFGYGRFGRWTTDYPKADRQFVQGVRRLTRLSTRSIEQVVNPSSDDLYDWPWTYAVEVGSWAFTPDEAVRMREYLLRGGFLMVDDFHGTYEWQSFLAGMRMVFPGRPVEDLANNDEIFHVLSDLDERFQVPGLQFFRSGRTYERDGVEAKWRAIRDDNGRILVAICHNMDLGDAWEWADLPQYPERFTTLAYRIGVNYIIYAMTH